MKKFLLTLAALIVAGGAVFALGPTEPVDQTVTFDAASLGDDLDSYLAEAEKNVPDLVDGAQKQIVWADPTRKEATPLSIVYIHGFSASLEEIRPLPDIVARELGANLFYSRLTGHGQNGAAMAKAEVGDWLRDTAEAIEIGRRIGEDVIVMGTSTGGTLATWAAVQEKLTDRVAGMVMISPNYKLQNPAAFLLTLPWARHFVPLIAGQERSFEPVNDGHGKWWTSRYPTTATLPMAASVEMANSIDVSKVEIPALFIYHREDQVVNPERIREIAEQWGSGVENPADTVEVGETDDPYKHVIAGRILSPSTTDALAENVTDWIRSL